MLDVTWSETPKTGFHVIRLNVVQYSNSKILICKKVNKCQNDHYCTTLLVIVRKRIRIMCDCSFFLCVEVIEGMCD